MLILQTDIDNIDECVLMLNSAEAADDLRIELKDGLALTERLLSQPNAYYTSLRCCDQQTIRKLFSRTAIRF